jgi:hypothetical protein
MQAESVLTPMTELIAIAITTIVMIRSEVVGVCGAVGAGVTRWSGCQRPISDFLFDRRCDNRERFGQRRGEQLQDALGFLMPVSARV